MMKNKNILFASKANVSSKRIISNILLFVIYNFSQRSKTRIVNCAVSQDLFVVKFSGVLRVKYSYYYQ